MEHTDYVILFAVAFFYMALKATSIISVARNRILAVGIISLCITYTWTFVILRIVEDPDMVHIYAFGCSLGMMFGTWIDKRFLKKKESDDYVRGASKGIALAVAILEEHELNAIKEVRDERKWTNDV